MAAVRLPRENPAETPLRWPPASKLHGTRTPERSGALLLHGLASEHLGFSDSPREGRRRAAEGEERTSLAEI